MKFSVDKQEHHSIFKLDEEKLNSLIAPQLKAEMVVLNAEGVRNIIFDLSSVRFVDSSGLSSILVTDRLCKTAKGTFVLTNISYNVMKLIKISQLENILNIVPTMQEAVDLVILDETGRNMKKA